MFLTILDLVLILILFIFITFGFVLGLLQAIGAIVGLALGTWLAGLYYQPIASWLTPFFLGHDIAAKIVAFILIFSIANRAVGLLFWVLNKIFNLISIIPFTKSINRILGAVLGLVEGVLATGIILYFTSQLTFAQWFGGVIASSHVAQWLIMMAKILQPLLPDVIKNLNPLALF